MQFLLRALAVFVIFVVALSIVKFLFIKLFVLALWVAAIAFVIYILSAVFKKA